MNTLLTASKLTFSYGDPPALRDVSLALRSGELVAIIGPNGSGKSTLIRALLGQHNASGSIEWDGKPIHRWSRRELARRIAYLAQNPTSDPDQRVADVLRLGRAPYWQAFGIESPADEQIVRAEAERLQLIDLMDRLMSQLSGGQRQRVFIGRCLVQQPAAMLLDEPSTFLDLRHQVELLKTLRQLARERSLGVLMASHDLNLAAAFADRLIVLNEGQVVAEGKPAEVMRPEIIGQVYGLQMQYAQGAGGASFLFPVIEPAVALDSRASSP